MVIGSSVSPIANRSYNVVVISLHPRSRHWHHSFTDRARSWRTIFDHIPFVVPAFQDRRDAMQDRSVPGEKEALRPCPKMMIEKMTACPPRRHSRKRSQLHKDVLRPLLVNLELGDDELCLVHDKSTCDLDKQRSW
jgi:hypothetical protein